MSDISEARAISYLCDALDDAPLIESALKERIFNRAIFLCQQICEKSAKACLASMNILITDEHKFVEYFEDFVMPESDDLNDDFEKLLRSLGKLETSYISSRYSVDRHGKVMNIKYDEAQVDSLCKDSYKFLELSFKFIERKIGKQLPRGRKDLKDYLNLQYSDNVEDLFL